MRDRAPWMKPSDDPILEFVEHVGEVTPSVIARNLDMHRKYAGERCRELAKYGLLESTGDGFYRITSSGERYLSGELDAATLEDTPESDS